jgi:hypothetical protein
MLTNCKTCHKNTFDISTHRCATRWLLWDEKDLTAEAWEVFDDEDYQAVEEYIRQSDEQYAEFTVDKVIVIQNPVTKEIKKFRVQGLMEPVYRATELK